MALASAQPRTVPPSRDADFAAIALPLLPDVARVARALVRDPADADDLVQETFLRAYRYWHTFQRDTVCKRWLSQICRNVLVDSLRRERHETAVEDSELESLAAVRIHKAAVSAGLGEPMVGISASTLAEADRLEVRGW